MSYQSVGSPRFYINMHHWYQSKHNNPPVMSEQAEDYGYDPEIGISTTFLTTPVDVNPVINSSYQIDDDHGNYNMGIYHLTSNAFIALLGYSKNGGDNIIRFTNQDGLHIPTQNIINMETISSSQDDIYSPYDGFSIATFTSDQEWINDNFMGADLTFPITASIGSIVVGNYFDLPRSSEVELEMTRDLDAVKRIRTKGGVDLVDYDYIKPRMWGDAGAWEIPDQSLGNQALSRIGRRSWTLSFKGMRDKYLNPISYSNNPMIHDPSVYEGLEDGSHWSYPDFSLTDNYLLQSNDFYSQVIHRTNGGQLPLIFQPDNTNNNTDGFAIVQLDMKSFKYKQVSNTIYDIQLKLKEVW